MLNPCIPLEETEKTEGGKSLEMRVAEREGTLRGMQVSADEIKAFDKISTMLSGGQFGGTEAGAVEAAAAKGLTPTAGCVINQRTIRACTIIQDCINECGGGCVPTGGGFSGSGFSGSGFGRAGVQPADRLAHLGADVERASSAGPQRPAGHAPLAPRSRDPSSCRRNRGDRCAPAGPRTHRRTEAHRSSRASAVHAPAPARRRGRAAACRFDVDPNTPIPAPSRITATPVTAS